jgi:hypothetical protein
MRRLLVAVMAAATLVWVVAASSGARALTHILRNLEASPVDTGVAEKFRPELSLPRITEEEAIRKGIPRGYRPATFLDAEPTPDREDLSNLYLDYQPYFVRGDVNADGVIDFATAYVIERDGGLLFDVAVFLGRDGGGFGEPRFVERGTSLSFGDLSIDRSIVVITPDLGAETSRRYRYLSKRDMFEDVDSRPAESPNPEPPYDGPEESPDHRSRARA